MKKKNSFYKTKKNFKSGYQASQWARQSFHTFKGKAYVDGEWKRVEKKGLTMYEVYELKYAEKQHTLKNKYGENARMKETKLKKAQFYGAYASGYNNDDIYLKTGEISKRHNITDWIVDEQAYFLTEKQAKKVYERAYEISTENVKSKRKEVPTAETIRKIRAGKYGFTADFFAIIQNEYEQLLDQGYTKKQARNEIKNMYWGSK